SHEDNKFFSCDPEVKPSDTKWGHHLRSSLELLWRHYFPLHDNFKLGAFVNGLGTIQKLYQNYTATMIHAAAFAPTPSTRNYFNVAFRSDNYAAIGTMPVWTPISHAQLRGDFFMFCPIRGVKQGASGITVYDGWFTKPQFVGEVAAVYNFPFASLSVYANYLSSPAHNWNFGINFGLYFQAPRLLR
ncbi:MAG: patatin, partial [Muribaculaceae bacterium]|nr:patatin [Muribaculaceae bacterium]